MGMVHQECLISWLEATRGDGRCEICKFKFHFDPQYAENTPDRLPAHEVLLGLSSRFLAKWLPLALRILFAVFLWLVVAPYLTNCLYLGWIVRPSSILGREDTLALDIVSGAVMGATIIISFLCLMSFADFLRVFWQQPPLGGQPPREGEGERQREEVGRENDTAVNEGNGNDDKIDNCFVDSGIVDQIEKEKLAKNNNNDNNTKTDTATTMEEIPEATKLMEHLVPADLERFGSELETDHLGLDPETEHLRNRATLLRNLAMERERRLQNDGMDGQDGEEDGDGDEQVVLLADDADEPNRRPNILVEDVDDHDDSDDDSFIVEEMNDDDDDDREHWFNNNNNDINDQAGRIPDFQQLRVGPEDVVDPMDPVLQDDQVDMEINVALDELLGLRGPISTLVRNLLWLLAFNATYLGIFGFIPKTVGSVIYSGLFNTTLCDTMLKSVPFLSSEDKNQTTLVSMLSALEEESENRNTTFKLSDFATVTLGYLSMACFIVISRYAIIALQKAGKVIRRKPSKTGHVDDAQHLQRVRRFRNFPRGLGEDMNELDEEDAIRGLGYSIETALDATVAIIKVCVLLFIKMFLLPLGLGIWLDASTVRLFGHDVARRLAFAGGDLFSFLLLHWVAGISFMLLVTVFLLQLREVAHPDILARLIRPQEPQPDLLGNLMHETVLTHMKRMALSLAIYAPLLVLHVTVPAMIFRASGLDTVFTFFHLNFYHILTPQLQIPLELITFHLSMLALLERHKNTIGGLQHWWLKLMCRTMGLTEHLLPQSIKAFELIGTRSVFKAQSAMEDLKVDPFFYELAKKEKDVDEFVLFNIDKVTELVQCTKQRPNFELANGRDVFSIGIHAIALPQTEVGETKTLLLPTKIGRYRLELENHNTNPTAQNMKIDFYRELQGDEIKRPPEGWDDLGAGGADVQGRWAWANEKKSAVEESLASRTPFRSSSKQPRSAKLITKVVLLVLLGWLAVIFTVLGIFSCPLAVGRSFYHLLRIAPKYIHDPLAFCIGAGLFFPTVSLLVRNINASDQSLQQRCRCWVGKFRRPPRGKALVVLECLLLWIVVAPIALGLSYEFVAVKSPTWFSREEPFLDFKTLAIAWLMGSVVLNTWSFLLYCKFFTRQFWSIVGNGILEPPLMEDGNPNPNAGVNFEDDAQGEAGMVWQGRQGRVAKFFKIMRSVLFQWEWDTVDRTIMIDDFARPTTKEIASALVGSALSFQLALYAFAIFKVQKGGLTLPLVGFVEVGVFRKFLFQVCMAVHVLFQIGSRSRANTDRWFEAAHEAARDDRYLIGELLMNYHPGEQTN
mmetsp:Transcript_22137/g.61597  ORF Transcript_22137/g.61597 Transcript_22137/m.61597 type:complete len:1302 (+) Transcript_22137:1087-4992(+)